MSKKDLADKAMKIQGKDYVLVKDRIIFLAENYEGKYSIVTAPTYYPDEKMWVVKAVLTIDFQNGQRDYVGHAQEIEGQGNVNRTSALENAETSAVGRACAMAGIGVIDSIASVDEIKKAENRSQAQKSSNVIEEFRGVGENGEPYYFKHGLNKDGKEYWMFEDQSDGNITWLTPEKFASAKAKYGEKPKLDEKPF